MVYFNFYRGHTLRIELGIIALMILSLAGSADARTWTVDDSGGANFTRIQDAIDAASGGDTILVYSGTYYENVDVNKQLILRGVDNGLGMPAVDAGGNPIAISLRAGKITLEGFNAKNSSFWDGISVLSNNNIIKNNNVSNNNNGIFLAPDSTNNTVIDNIANSNREYGIFLFAGNNIVSGNTANSNGHSGIFLYSYDNNIIYNNIANSNNYYGIFLSVSNSNTLTGNNASSNTGYGILLDSSNSNTIYNNYFNNLKNAYDNGNNIWNITKTAGTNIIGGPYLGGNYWSDYAGKDTDGDGLGDTQLPYNSAGNILNGGDYLPLTPAVTSISIYTDKSSYKASDKMYVGLNITNPGDAQKVGIYIWLDLPGGGKQKVVSYPSITLPAGLDWKRYPFKSPTLPKIPAGNYSWHAILKNTTSGSIISESISPWTFSDISQAGTGSEVEMGAVLQEESVFFLNR